jgi:hypothetical protein
MNRHNFIGVTILVSVLALNPLIATEIQNRVQTKVNNVLPVSGNIASILHKRGLEKDAAEEIADSMVGEDEELLGQQIENLSIVVTQEEIFEHLSTVALYRKHIKLDRYDHLVSMVSHIRKSNSLNKSLLAQLQFVAKLNSQLVG